MLKKPSLSHFLKRLSRKHAGGDNNNGASSSGGESGGPAEGTRGGSRRRRFRSFSSGLRWKRKFSFHLWFVDGFLFKIVYVLEAMVLVLTLCLFYLCFGCNL